jgi:hypothetical protein
MRQGRRRITARVKSTGEVCIALESDRGDCLGSTPRGYWLRPMAHPRDGAFMVERFTGGTGHLPVLRFGRVR